MIAISICFTFLALILFIKFFPGLSILALFIGKPYLFLSLFSFPVLVGAAGKVIS